MNTFNNSKSLVEKRRAPGNVLLDQAISDDSQVQKKGAPKLQEHLSNMNSQEQTSTVVFKGDVLATMSKPSDVEEAYDLLPSLCQT
jgi:hypothetical protein